MKNEEDIKDIVGSTRKLVRSVYLDSWKMSKRSGLTGPQTLALRCLAASGPLSSAELSRRLFVTPSNMTGLVDRLEKKGLVQRTQKPGDRRVMLITLTGSGTSLAATLPDPIERKLVAGLAGLEAERVQGIARALHHILDLIDARESEDAPLDWKAVSQGAETRKGALSGVMSLDIPAVATDGPEAGTTAPDRPQKEDEGA